MFHYLRAFAQTTTYLGAAVIVGIWCGVLYLTHEQHARAYENAVQQGSNLTRIFSEYISRVIGGTDGTLITLRETYEHDPNHFDIARLAGRAQAQNKAILNFGLVGLDGYVKLAGEHSRALVSDREYFRFHAN